MHSELAEPTLGDVLKSQPLVVKLPFWPNTLIGTGGVPVNGGVNIRMRLFTRSEMKKFPAPSKLIPSGRFRLFAVTPPELQPLEMKSGWPKATLAVVLGGLVASGLAYLSTRQLPSSVANRLPAGSKAMISGWQREVAVGCPAPPKLQVF